MCALPCEERSPSCEGMRDGNNTFIGRELSPFYISCFKERTLSVGICRYGVYDPNLRFCTTELDPCKKLFHKFQEIVFGCFVKANEKSFLKLFLNFQTQSTLSAPSARRRFSPTSLTVPGTITVVL